MFKVITAEPKGRIGRIKAGCSSALSAMQGHIGKILYYLCLAAALTAIACAAQQYRNRQPIPGPEAPVSANISADVAEESSFLWPEEMGLMKEYALLPEWSEEFGCWQNHEAVDFACDVACAFASGTIQSVGKDGIHGGYLEILSGDYLFRYASIIPDKELTPGKEIGAGEKIGITDTSKPGEAESGAHLHLEVYKEGKSLDYVKLSREKKA